MMPSNPSFLTRKKIRDYLSVAADSSEPLRQRLKEQAQFLAGLVQRWNFLFNPGL
jgi:hypothetical protein